VLHQLQGHAERRLRGREDEVDVVGLDLALQDDAPAVVVSLRGGDFLFDCGEDISIGYDHTDAQRVNLYLSESFSFRVVTPEAAVALGEAPSAR
jgi:uncharacterized linocin/CFP29 family protein